MTMADDVLHGETTKQGEDTREQQKLGEYPVYYNRDTKLESLSSLYSQYPLWVIQQESKLASYGLLTKWNSVYSRMDTSFRRRLQTKDNTGALRMWLLRHKKNPYPTKPEKIMLAILSRMTMTQVSTWFANARRRLKKEFPENAEYSRADISDEESSTSFCQTLFSEQK